MCSKSCQATVEYLLMVTAIILALIIGFKGSIKNGLDTYYNALGDKISHIIGDH